MQRGRERGSFTGGLGREFIFSGLEISRTLIRDVPPPSGKFQKEGLSLACKLGEVVEHALLRHITQQGGGFIPSEVEKVYVSIAEELKPTLLRRMDSASQIVSAYENVLKLDEQMVPREDVNAVLIGTDIAMSSELLPQFVNYGIRQMALIEEDDQQDKLHLTNIQRYPLEAALCIVGVGLETDSILQQMFLTKDAVQNILSDVTLTVNSTSSVQFDGVILSDLLSSVSNWLATGKAVGQLESGGWSIIEVKMALTPRNVTSEGPTRPRKKDLASTLQKIADFMVDRKIHGEPISFPDRTYLIYPRGVLASKVFRVEFNEKFYFDWFQKILDLYISVKDEWQNDPFMTNELDRLRSFGLILADEVRSRRKKDTVKERPTPLNTVPVYQANLFN